MQLKLAKKYLLFLMGFKLKLYLFLNQFTIYLEIENLDRNEIAKELYKFYTFYNFNLA